MDLTLCPVSLCHLAYDAIKCSSLNHDFLIPTVSIYYRCQIYSANIQHSQRSVRQSFHYQSYRSENPFSILFKYRNRQGRLYLLPLFCDNNRVLCCISYWYTYLSNGFAEHQILVQIMFKWYFCAVLTLFYLLTC